MTTAIKERPILFSGPMVRAILEGRKTQTRRVIKDVVIGPGDCPSFGRGKHMGNIVKPKYCPHGQPGDQLWVRETWAGCCDRYAYKADGHRTLDWLKMARHKLHDVKWRPSIFMPRWASRITLEVTGIRVERVQEISEEDAKAEGVDANSMERWESKDDTPIGMFGGLWDSINAKRGFGWEKNPWNWVVTFKKAGA